jgi:hypothetical protein
MSSSEKFERDFEAFLKEDSELAALYRKLPRPEPDAKLDAAVLSMAHRALNPQLVATPTATSRTSAARRRARWLPALSAAATAVFAIGVAIKMGPLIWSERHAEAPSAAAARDDGVVHVRTIDEPAPPPPPASPPPPPPAPVVANGLASSTRQEAARAAAKPVAAPPAAPVPQKPAPVAEAPGVSAEAFEFGKKELQKTDNVAQPKAAPQAFPAQASHTEMDAVERKQAMAEGAWQRLHDSDAAAAGGAAVGSVSKSAAAVEQHKPAAPPPASAAAPALRAKAPASAAEPMGLEAEKLKAAQPEKDKGQALDTVTVTGSNIRRVDVDTASAVPADERAAATKPAEGSRDKVKRESRTYSAEVMRNSRLYPESWVAAIQRLIHAGRRDDARQNLDLFREKYPQYHLPADIERFALEAR